MTQEVLAEKTNLSTKYIGHLEQGYKNPSLEALVRIANALEISTDLLLFDLVDNSYNDRNCYLNQKISKLPKENQKFIFSVIEVMLKEME